MRVEKKPFFEIEIEKKITEIKRNFKKKKII